MIDAVTLINTLRYDPATGVFTRFDGSIAGCKNSQGYVQIGVCGEKHRAHRLAWLYIYGQWPSGLLDHINGVRDDNRIENLRLATRQQNMANSKARANKSLPKGVVMIHPTRYRAVICINNKRCHIGYYKTIESAHAAYCEAAQKAFGAYHRAG